MYHHGEWRETSRASRPSVVAEFRTYDPLVPLVNAKIMQRLIPHAKLYIFHDGHLGLGTSAQELAQVVDQFLTDPAAASTSRA